jgi:FkbM family methyltransferase
VKRTLLQGVLALLRWYTRFVPFARGRGLMIRVIEACAARGWPRPLVPIPSNLNMEFEPSLLGWTVFERGAWEPEQTDLLLPHLGPGTVVLNVGANTGYYALLAGVAVAPGGRVYAFEMQPAMAAFLRRNVQHNDLENVVTIVESGCFSTDGEAFIESKGDPGSARVSLTGTGIRVPLITLDGYIRDHGVSRVDAILIDAEGADFEILKGARDVLTRDRPLVLAEVHHLDAFGGTDRELLRFMADLGYAATELRGRFSRDMLFRAANERR